MDMKHSTKRCAPKILSTFILTSQHITYSSPNRGSQNIYSYLDFDTVLSGNYWRFKMYQLAASLQKCHCFTQCRKLSKKVFYRPMKIKLISE